MTEIFDALSDASVWETFYRYKSENRHLSRSEEKDLRLFISERAYLPVLDRLSSGGSFSTPEKKMIRKVHTAKKRVVYTYPREENYVLKLMTYLLLRKYDGIFSPNLYSFRVDSGISRAMGMILRTSGIRKKYTYKVDISNYFNSIDIEMMLAQLQEVLSEDPKTLELFESLLRNPDVIDRGRTVREEKGVMAGTPFAVFLANVFLSELDRAFFDSGILYARYSDDIMIFTDTEAGLDAGETLIRKTLSDKGLRINEEKEVRTLPGEPWSFLGITYSDGTVDISQVSKDKLKAKIRRKARNLRRWQARKGATDQQTVRAFIRSMNRKFFDNDAEHELTWTRWYFPLITTDVTLKEIDAYMLDWARYLAVGTHAKKRFDFRYEDFKAAGGISLVNAWYRYRKKKFTGQIPGEIMGDES